MLARKLVGSPDQPDHGKKRISFAEKKREFHHILSKSQRLKIEQSRRGGVRYGAERLRQTELEIDEASRLLRRARNGVDMARDELRELEDRHRAVLSYYDPDQASKLVGEALDDFSGQVDSSSSPPPQSDTSAAPQNE